MYNFPAVWNDEKVSNRKKRKFEEPIVSTSATEDLPESFTTLPPYVQEIMKTIHHSKTTPLIPAEFDLDVILSNVSFHNILSSFYHGNDTSSLPDVPLVTKAFEETYMREPHNDERACVCGSMCECNFIDTKAPFTCVEFVVPGEALSETPQMCVICSRKATQKLFYDMLYNASVERRGLIQRFGNICNVEGEYARECMLICPTQGPLHCMPIPIMSHQRNKYKVYLNNGVRSLRQTNVSFEDFQSLSTSEPTK
jgi:hypothetical protein